MTERIDQTRWVITAKYIPRCNHGEAPEFTNHEAILHRER
jgi:hypothetical protein